MKEKENRPTFWMCCCPTGATLKTCRLCSGFHFCLSEASRSIETCACSCPSTQNAPAPPECSCPPHNAPAPPIMLLWRLRLKLGNIKTNIHHISVMMTFDLNRSNLRQRALNKKDSFDFVTVWIDVLFCRGSAGWRQKVWKKSAF